MKRNGCTQFQWIDLSMKTFKGSSAKKPTAPELQNIEIYNRKEKDLRDKVT